MADQLIKHEASPSSDPKGNGGDGTPSVPPISLAPAHGAAAHGHGHGLAHTTPVSLLIAILAALMILTLITVAVSSVDLGSQGNLVVAMVIATIKAALVVAFFLHVVWDKKLHLILFLVSVLFLILFLSGSVTDRAEYEPDIQQFQVGAAQ